jgi:hypothetical protein
MAVSSREKATCPIQSLALEKAGKAHAQLQPDHSKSNCSRPHWRVQREPNCSRQAVKSNRRRYTWCVEQPKGIFGMANLPVLTAERQALPTVSTLYMKLREAEQWVRQEERLTHRNWPVWTLVLAAQRARSQQRPGRAALAMAGGFFFFLDTM